MPRYQAPHGRNGTYNSSLPTIPDGDGADFQFDSSGRLIVSPSSGTTPSVVGLEYNSTPPTLTNGQTDALQGDANGNLKVREQYAPAAEDNTNQVIAVATRPVASSNYAGTAFSARLNDVDISVKASAGNLLSVSATNINAAIRYLQLFNKASAPSGGDSPVFSFPIAAGSSTAPSVVTLGRDFLGANGHHFATGIAIGLSTAADTFTAATTTDHVVNGTYV